MNNKITDNIINIGVDDHQIDLFEGQYKVPKGMRYNSYLIIDDKIAILDSVDYKFKDEWLDKLNKELKGRIPDYLIIHHMEPDHSANIMNLVKAYPTIILIGNLKTFQMLDSFFPNEEYHKQIVNENDILDLGHHQLKFIMAPMVHWPEVMMSYEINNKVLFSADAFGKFGSLDIDDDWDDEGRRYYYGIVGKYGVQVQNVIKKLASFDLKCICSLHGPILNNNLDHYLSLYQKWSTYSYEEEDKVLILYTSVYNHTKEAVLKLQKLLNNNCVIYDLARSDMSLCVAEAFRYKKIVLATTTYNADIYPFMKELIIELVDRNFQNHQIAIIENGSWAPMVVKKIKTYLENSKNIEYIGEVHIKSSLDNNSLKELETLNEVLNRR